MNGGEVPGPGGYALDVRGGRIGEVTGREGGRVRLRPVGGGREWDRPSGERGEPQPSEVPRERVRRLNRAPRPSA